jgi:hypothetical protein
MENLKVNFHLKIKIYYYFYKHGFFSNFKETLFVLNFFLIFSKSIPKKFFFDGSIQFENGTLTILLISPEQSSLL